MITCQLATIPQRIEILPKVINSLLLQVDRLNVMLNSFTDDQAVRFFNIHFFNDKVYFIRRNNEMTDGEKYYNIENAAPGYIFTCDDDILYPPDYVQKSIETIEKYGRKYVITYHGRVWNHPCKNYYTDRWHKGMEDEGMYRCIEGFEGDHFVDCGGDGVAAWHTDTLKMRYDYCEHKNMSQLWLALKCNEDGIKQKAIGHPEGWLKDLTIPGTEDDCIWSQEINSCQLQTRLINERWKQTSNG
jgi:hypothetical protein